MVCCAFLCLLAVPAELPRQILPHFFARCLGHGAVAGQVFHAHAPQAIQGRGPIIGRDIDLRSLQRELLGRHHMGRVLGVLVAVGDDRVIDAPCRLQRPQHPPRHQVMGMAPVIGQEALAHAIVEIGPAALAGAAGMEQHRIGRQEDAKVGPAAGIYGKAEVPIVVAELSDIGRDPRGGFAIRLIVALGGLHAWISSFLTGSGVTGRSTPPAWRAASGLVAAGPCMAMPVPRSLRASGLGFFGLNGFACNATL